MITNEIYTRYHYYTKEELQKSLIGACRWGNLDLVKYFLTNDDISNHLNIHMDEDNALRTALCSQNLDIVRFLCTSSKLKEHAHIYHDNNIILETIIQTQNIEILKFFIFEMNMDKIFLNIDDFKHINSDYYEIASKLFETRDIMMDLKEKLVTNNAKSKSSKL
jgi:hypothetical protein